jgi:predicted peroxiredoxin
MASEGPLRKRLAILMWAADADDPARAATPIFHAAVAAAMDAEVEIHFTARAVHLLVEGVAGNLRSSPTDPKTLLDFLREAYGHGVRLLACTHALAAHAPGATLIAECAGPVGAAAFVDRQLDPDWVCAIY